MGNPARRGRGLNKDLHVVVLMGGWSAEREVSLTSGKGVTVQGMLDLMGVRYTHSGLETSVIAIDKELTKMVLVPHGIRMPAGRVIESQSVFSSDPMDRPYVLKPVNEGSSVGVAIVT